MKLPTYLLSDKFEAPKSISMSDTKDLSYWFRPTEGGRLGVNPETWGIYGRGLYLLRSEIKADYYAEIKNERVSVYAVNLDTPLISTLDAEFIEMVGPLLSSFGSTVEKYNAQHPQAVEISQKVQHEVLNLGYRGVFDPKEYSLTLYEPSKDSILMGERTLEKKSLDPKAPSAINAVAVVLTREDEILLLKRRPDAKVFPNMWSLPGGFINTEEFPLQAAIRSVAEEVGVGLYRVYVKSKGVCTFHRTRIEIFETVFREAIDLENVTFKRFKNLPVNPEFGITENDKKDWFRRQDLTNLPLTPLARTILNRL